MAGPVSRSPAFGLPIDEHIEEIAQLLDRGSLALSAETGAGKTTALQAALALRYAGKGRILVLEPRRLAAIGAAQRCAELLGAALGSSVGYRVRGDTKAGPATRLEFMTVAVFLRIVQEDPFLEGLRLVVFDEFHERSAAGDLCLAFAREAAELRDGLSLLVMSATLEADGVAAYLGCPALSVPGRAYPVELAYRPPAPGQEPVEAAARAAAELYGSLSGSTLVFLPGQRELNEAQGLLRSLAPRADTDLLYGALSLERQRAVIAPGGRPKRIILSTSIAETSLTVPGVVAVVDAGLARFTRYHERSGMNRLVTERVSAAEAEQRRGRAGRLQPGLCLRCWSPDDRLKSLRDPEILRTELAGLALECALRGDSESASVRWLDAPPGSAWEAGRELLRELGLLDGEFAINSRGKKALGLGADPRSAAALLSAAPEDRQAAALCAALLAEGYTGNPGDEGDLRALFESAAVPGGRPRRAALEEAERLCRKAYALAFSPAEALEAAGRLGGILAAGFPDRIARRVDDGWEFRSGRRARHRAGLPERGWLVALDCDAGSSQIAIHKAVPLDEEGARRALMASARDLSSIEWRGLTPRAFERRVAGAFVLRERQLKEPAPGQALRAAEARIEAEGLSWLPWQEASEALLERIRYAARLGRPAGLDPEAWQEPRFAGCLAEALKPYLAASGPIIDGAGLLACLEDTLRSELGYAALEILEREAPAFIITPGGRRRRPRYPMQGEASLALRIQEAFGLRDSPAVCGRPLVLELLSPADRPLQLTKDLASFWRTAYPALRPELSRRYPKHYWPEDPLSAEPTRGPKPKRL